MIEQIFIISLFTLGYCCTFWPGMIFEHLGEWAELHIPDWLWKPLGGCYICACMWIGTIAYWIMWGNAQSRTLLNWFITVVSAMGVNTVFSFIHRIAENANQEK